MKVAVQRWKRRELAMVFGQWGDFLSHRVLCRRVMTKLLSHYQRSGQSKGFASWRYFIESVKAQFAEEQRLETSMRRCVTRMSQITLGRAFSRWMETARESKELRRVAASVLGRWQHRTMAAVMRKWVYALDEKRRAVRAMQRLVASFQRDGRTLAFRTWRNHVEESRLRSGQDVRMRRLIARWQNQSVYQALTTWSAFAHHRRSCRRIVWRLIKSSRRESRAAAFRVWQFTTLSERAYAVTDARAASAVVRWARGAQRSKLRAAWQIWMRALRRWVLLFSHN